MRFGLVLVPRHPSDAAPLASTCMAQEIIVLLRCYGAGYYGCFIMDLSVFSKATIFTLSGDEPFDGMIDDRLIQIDMLSGLYECLHHECCQPR